LMVAITGKAKPPPLARAISVTRAIICDSVIPGLAMDIAVRCILRDVLTARSISAISYWDFIIRSSEMAMISWTEASLDAASPPFIPNWHNFLRCSSR